MQFVRQNSRLVQCRRTFTFVLAKDSVVESEEFKLRRCDLLCIVCLDAWRGSNARVQYAVWSLSHHGATAGSKSYGQREIRASP